MVVKRRLRVTCSSLVCALAFCAVTVAEAQTTLVLRPGETRDGILAAGTTPVTSASGTFAGATLTYDRLDNEQNIRFFLDANVCSPSLLLGQFWYRRHSGRSVRQRQTVRGLLRRPTR